ncbi:MAG TPA: hypothetical protein VI168_06005, partial [Croceibacterium sp.]
MSVLEIPRVYFKGQVAWDPVTTNNYPSGQAPAGYDEDDCDSTLNAVAVGTASVAGFRQAAIDEIVSKGNWNPAGSYRCPFFDTCISGVDLGQGLDTGDPFVGAPVQFTGMLVDCEPYGATSSQLFFDDMSFGIDGGCRIYGQRVTRYSDRYINFAANPANNMIAGVASVMWQTCFDKNKGLAIDAHDSAVLAALQACVGDDDVLGVMVRFVTYRTVYYDDPTLFNGSPAGATAGKALQDKLKAGGFQPNPARSLLVGTVGLWRKGDAPTEPSDRTLLTTGVPVTVSSDPKVGQGSCGTAWMRLGSDRLTLDMSNFVPWGSRTPDKADLGTLKIVAADPPPAVAIMDVATLAYAQYDQAAYEATSGIVDIPLASGLAATLANMDFSVLGGDGTKLLEEAPLRAIPADPNLYADQGDAVTTTVQVYERGVPAGAGIEVTLSEIGATQQTGLSQTTDAQGQVSFPLSTTTGTVTGLALQPGADPTLPVTANAFDPQTYTYITFRVLPADTSIGALPPTWDNVHNYVLSNWEAFAPCMDNWLRLGDEAQVQAYAPVIRKLTDPANFE